MSISSQWLNSILSETIMTRATKKAIRRGAYGAAGTVAGGLAGSALGGPAGAVAGAMGGSALGYGLYAKSDKMPSKKAKQYTMAAALGGFGVPGLGGAAFTYLGASEDKLEPKDKPRAISILKLISPENTDAQLKTTINNMTYADYNNKINKAIGRVEKEILELKIKQLKKHKDLDIKQKLNERKIFATKLIRGRI